MGILHANAIEQRALQQTDREQNGMLIEQMQKECQRSPNFSRTCLTNSERRTRPRRPVKAAFQTMSAKHDEKLFLAPKNALQKRH